jgi:hypothetical protein
MSAADSGLLILAAKGCAGIVTNLAGRVARSSAAMTLVMIRKKNSIYPAVKAPTRPHNIRLNFFWQGLETPVQEVEIMEKNLERSFVCD